MFPLLYLTFTLQFIIVSVFPPNYSETTLKEINKFYIQSHWFLFNAIISLHLTLYTTFSMSSVWSFFFLLLPTISLSLPNILHISHSFPDWNFSPQCTIFVLTLFLIFSCFFNSNFPFISWLHILTTISFYHKLLTPIILIYPLLQIHSHDSHVYFNYSLDFYLAVKVLQFTIFKPCLFSLLSIITIIITGTYVLHITCQILLSVLQIYSSSWSS